MAFRLAVSEADRLSAFRLRYDVYIAEQGKPYPGADHTNRLMVDELDADAEIIIVEADGVVVGTVRGNPFTCRATFEHYASPFELHRFSAMQLNEMYVCSRLAASTEYRHAAARDLLFRGIYEHGLRLGTRLCFATCAPVLIRMFRRYGFREYASPILDPIVGALHRMVLVLDDVTYLAQVRSPFEPIARAHGIEIQPRPWLESALCFQEAATA